MGSTLLLIQSNNSLAETNTGFSLTPLVDEVVVAWSSCLRDFSPHKNESLVLKEHVVNGLRACHLRVEL